MSMIDNVADVAMWKTLSRERTLKRCFDIAGAAVSLILFSPLFLVIYLALKYEGGPIIFRQERIGYKGQSFMLYKFRSMIVKAEAEGPQLAKGMDDKRLTKVGRFLRTHHLDELPQLWNVLKGDMSFVGYRPERRFFIEQIMEKNSDYELLYELRPGITSMATLDNGYTDSMAKMLKRLEMDLEYMRNCSLWLDLKILFTTFWRILTGIKF
jgi:lipopolysaccharide/colanic/teichoic acid biosynthesis glycosyltransferase